MKILHAALALSLITAANILLAQASAQTTGTESPDVRDIVKPAPADGAIKGGSISRGGGTGTEGATPGIGAESGSPSEEAVKRCNELSGSLREQCLLQERGAGTGSTRDKPDERKADPREAPPPQNPR
jgi:hypothetical protein